MRDELFDVPVVKSPRLKWIEKHGLYTQHFPDVKPGDDDPETGEEIYPWRAWVGNMRHARICAGGATEDDALAEWAKASGVLLWNEETGA